MSVFQHKGSYFYKPEGALTNLMFSRMARTVAATLVHIFSPVFIYKTMSDAGHGYKYAILFALSYYFLASSVSLITQYLSENISRRIGFKNVIRLSLLPFFLFVIFVNKAPENFSFFWLAAIFWGLNAGFYWWGYHGYFVKKGNKNHFGTTIGEANFLETIAAILTPILGAIVVSLGGFETLFSVSLIFVLLSIFLLGKGSKTRQKHDIKIGDMANLIKKHKLTAIAYVGMGADAMVRATIWPLFLYLFFGEVISLGATVTLSALIASIFSIIIGSKVDVDDGNGIVKVGSLVLFSSWVIRIFSQTVGIFVISDALGNFGQRMVSVPLNTLSYKKAIEFESAKAILFLETTQILGIMFGIILIAVFTYFNFGLLVAFLISAIFSLFPLYWAMRR